MGLPEHLKTGLRGEQLAARFLNGKHYKILAANFRCGNGETDIIARAPGRDGEICFVEVKTRSPGAALPPSEAVDAEKRRRLENCAAAYLKLTKRTDARFRFDIIEIILHNPDTADINHIENAF